MSGVDPDARERLAAALAESRPWNEAWAELPERLREQFRITADALLPVVQVMVAEGAAKELRAAADDLDDIAANLDPRRRSNGVARGYRLAAHVNRSIAAVLREDHPS